DGTDWSSPVPLPRWSDSVSCVSASFCMALENRGSVRWDGHAWRDAGDSVGGPGGVVSCSSATFCIALGGRRGLAQGTYSTWYGTSWSAVQHLISQNTFDISCPVDDFCQALGASKSVYTYDGGSWRKTQLLGPGGYDYGRSNVFVNLSCTATVTCTAISES